MRLIPGRRRDRRNADQAESKSKGAVPRWAIWGTRASFPLMLFIAGVGFWASYDGMKVAFDSQYDGALVLVLPILVDAWILYASVRWVAGVARGRYSNMWRVGAHVGIASTVTLNIIAAGGGWSSLWHAVGPTVWAALVELLAKDVLSDYEERATRRVRPERIPLRLWITAFRESARTSLRMVRTGTTDASVARVEADRCATAVDVLKLTIPVRYRRHRRMIIQRLKAGSLDPRDVLAAVGWTGQEQSGTPRRGSSKDPNAILRASLMTVLDLPDRRSDRSSPAVRSDQSDQATRAVRSGSPVQSESRTAVQSGPVIDLTEPDRSGPIEQSEGGPTGGSPVPATVRSDREQSARETGPVFPGSGDRVPSVRSIESARSRSSASTTTAAVAARPEDVQRLRAAIEAGELAVGASAEAYRQFLGVGAGKARAARAVVQAEHTPTGTD